MFNLLHLYEPNSIAFKIGFLSIYWYGIILVCAILSGYWIINKLSLKSGLSSEIISSIYVNALIFGFIGARAWHVASFWQSYIHNPIQIFAVWNGGLAIHGAIIGAVLSVIYFSGKNKINFWKIADLFALAAVLGQAIGRWGNYFNQELFGSPTGLWWGIPIDLARRPAGYARYEYFHPAFLYESALCVLIFVMLIFVFKKQKRPHGLVFWLYLALYSSARIIVESIRINDAAMIFSIRLPILTSAIFAAISIIAIARLLVIRRAP